MEETSAKVGDDYYIYYYGSTPTSKKMFVMPEGSEYRVDVLDTWNMTVTEMDGLYSGTFKIEWPSAKSMAVRIFRSDLSSPIGE